MDADNEELEEERWGVELVWELEIGLYISRKLRARFEEGVDDGKKDTPGRLDEEVVNLGPVVFRVRHIDLRPSTDRQIEKRQ